MYSSRLRNSTLTFKRAHLCEMLASLHLRILGRKCKFVCSFFHLTDSEEERRKKILAQKRREAERQKPSPGSMAIHSNRLSFFDNPTEPVRIDPWSFLGIPGKEPVAQSSPRGEDADAEEDEEVAGYEEEREKEESEEVQEVTTLNADLVGTSCSSNKRHPEVRNHQWHDENNQNHPPQFGAKTCPFCRLLQQKPVRLQKTQSQREASPRRSSQELWRRRGILSQPSRSRRCVSARTMIPRMTRASVSVRLP